MSSVGHPLLGDEVYGGAGSKFCQTNKKLISGQCLHAGELILTHPATKKEMHFKSSLPEEMEKLLDKLRKSQ